jgi:hypothetical protein
MVAPVYYLSLALAKMAVNVDQTCLETDLIALSLASRLDAFRSESAFGRLHILGNRLLRDVAGTVRPLGCSILSLRAYRLGAW